MATDPLDAFLNMLPGSLGDDPEIVAALDNLINSERQAAIGGRPISPITKMPDENWRDEQEPVRVETDGHEDYEETHPAYALIGASHFQGGDYALFGSEFRHNQSVHIRLIKARTLHGLHKDGYFSNHEPAVVEVILSEAQWAHFVSATNQGDGVPCTIERINGYGLPRILPIHDDWKTNLGTELNGTIADLLTRIDELIEKSNRGMSAKKVAFELGIIRSHLASNIPFVAKVFDEHAEDTIEKVKMEVEAYLENTLRRVGLEALGGAPPVALIEGGTNDH